MAIVYSTNFISLQGFTGNHNYSPPTGYKAVIRDGDWYVNAGLLDSGDFYMVGQADQIIDWFTVDVDTTVVHLWRGRQVIDEGGFFAVHSDLAADITISGYLLALP